MKTLKVIVSVVIGMSLLQLAKGQTEKAMPALQEIDYGWVSGKEDEKKFSLAVGLEPYGLMNWSGINGTSDLGAGLGLTVGITKNLSLVAFAEGDSLDNPNFFDQISRVGAGVRYTAWLGSRVSLDGGVAGAYDIHNENFFIRLPLGANLYAIKEANYDLGIRLQYAFDISGSGPNGTSAGTASVGPVFNLRF